MTPGQITISHECPLEALMIVIDGAGYEAVRLPEPWWSRLLRPSD